jgi:hypothetical protein
MIKRLFESAANTFGIKSFGRPCSCAEVKRGRLSFVANGSPCLGRVYTRKKFRERMSNQSGSPRQEIFSEQIA